MWSTGKMEKGQGKRGGKGRLPKGPLKGLEKIDPTILKKQRSRNALVGLGILAGAFGIYAYTMYAVKQENFLDEEFDNPGTTSNTTNNENK